MINVNINMTKNEVGLILLLMAKVITIAVSNYYKW